MWTFGIQWLCVGWSSCLPAWKQTTLWPRTTSCHSASTWSDVGFPRKEKSPTWAVSQFFSIFVIFESLMFFPSIQFYLFFSENTCFFFYCFFPNIQPSPHLKTVGSNFFKGYIQNYWIGDRNVLKMITEWYKKFDYQLPVNKLV